MEVRKAAGMLAQEEKLNNQNLGHKEMNKLGNKRKKVSQRVRSKTQSPMHSSLSDWLLSLYYF
jgi:hypothetical protein